VKNGKLGKVYFAPCDVILSEEDIVQPDIFFISKEREHIITESFWNDTGLTCILQNKFEYKK